jgi:hypothetical protein
MNKPLAQLELIPAGTAPQVDTATTDPAAAAVERILAAAAPDDFDWATDDSVVVKPRRGVAIYENRAGDVVVRTQNMEEGPEDDHFAYLSPEGLPAVIKALKAYLP